MFTPREKYLISQAFAAGVAAGIRARDKTTDWLNIKAPVVQDWLDDEAGDGGVSVAAVLIKNAPKY